MTKSTYTLKATNPQGRTMALTFTNVAIMLEAEGEAVKMGYTVKSDFEDKIMATEAEAFSQLAQFINV